jgi:tellurite methyltransferase
MRFFDEQFKRQAAAGEFKLNPFEARALPYLRGNALELGCGLGNLAVAAAQQGARVTALDGSRLAIESLSARAKDLRLEITTGLVDLAEYEPERNYDCVVAIGLFMFFPCAVARRQLKRALAAVQPNGIAVVNVLIVGTTYMGMFDEEVGYCLFAEDELPDLLAGWHMLDDRIETFDAPGGTIKRFRTCIARKPLR